MLDIRVQTSLFDPALELARLCPGEHGGGAVVSFVGLVRDFSAGVAVHGLELEQYPGMTERALRDIATEASRRWELGHATIVHRVGALQPRDAIVFVAAVSAHRAAAFRGCEFMIDALKTRAPLWKRESTPQGGHWVQARMLDQEAARRWDDADPRD